MYIKCYACNGTGYTPYKHIADGICFRCDGKGKHKATNEEVTAHYDKLNKLNDQLSILKKEYSAYDKQFISLLDSSKNQLENGITERDRQELKKQLHESAQGMEDKEMEIKKIEKSIHNEKEKFIY